MSDLDWLNSDDAPLIFRLMGEFGLSKNEMARIVSIAPLRYKTYLIKKKNGSGSRIIAQPAAELKVLQRWLVSNFLNEMPVHAAATAYENNTSIKKNAEIHSQQKYLLKLDFENFFPSIRPSDLAFLLKTHGVKLTASDFNGLARLLFWSPPYINDRGLQLSIGAPSSPKVSNLMMFHIDNIISAYCMNQKISYTRFADDLTFSTNVPNSLKLCLEFIKKTIGETRSPHLTLHKDKIVFSSKKFNRRVTGLVLTNEGKVSLGHKKKRELKVAIHRFKCGKLTPIESSKLRGMLAYVNAVEKSFLDNMNKKYGESVIKNIQTYMPPTVV